MKQIYIKIKTCELKQMSVQTCHNFRVSIEYNNTSYHSRILFHQLSDLVEWNDIFLIPYDKKNNFLTLSIEQVFLSATNIECFEIKKVIVKIPTMDIEAKNIYPFSFDIGDLFYGYKNHIYNLQSYKRDVETKKIHMSSR